jgi:hypothetical protein
MRDWTEPQARANLLKRLVPEGNNIIDQPQARITSGTYDGDVKWTLSVSADWIAAKAGEKQEEDKRTSHSVNSHPQT